MATLDSVQNPGISAETDPTFRAARFSLRPLEYQTLQGKILGHYFAEGQTSAALFTGGVSLANFRFADPTNFAVIMRVYAYITVATAVTAQRIDPLELYVARGYTASETTNATAIVMGSTSKMRSTMGNSLLSSGQIAVASAAAGLTGGTKTLDTSAVGVGCSGAGLAALGTGTQVVDLYKWDKLGGHPVVLAGNEGLVLQWGTTALATGTVTVGFGVEWAEVAAF